MVHRKEFSFIRALAQVGFTIYSSIVMWCYVAFDMLEVDNQKLQKYFERPLLEELWTTSGSCMLKPIKAAFIDYERQTQKGCNWLGGVNSPQSIL